MYILDRYVVVNFSWLLDLFSVYVISFYFFGFECVNLIVCIVYKNFMIIIDKI